MRNVVRQLFRLIPSVFPIIRTRGLPTSESKGEMFPILRGGKVGVCEAGQRANATRRGELHNPRDAGDNSGTSAGLCVCASLCVYLVYNGRVRANGLKRESAGEGEGDATAGNKRASSRPRMGIRDTIVRGIVLVSTCCSSRFYMDGFLIGAVITPDN